MGPLHSGRGRSQSEPLADALALIHTFPFIVIDIRMGMIMHRWRTSFQYGTGVAALIPQTFLVTASIAAIRNRYYETFIA